MAANPQTKPTDLGCESADKWLLPYTSTIAICYYYSARKLILILPSNGGWKAESLSCTVFEISSLIYQKLRRLRDPVGGNLPCIRYYSSMHTKYGLSCDVVCVVVFFSFTCSKNTMRAQKYENESRDPSYAPIPS